MKRIKTVAVAAKKSVVGCGECRSTCQSACKPVVPSATNLAKSKPEKEKKRKFSRNSGGLSLLSLIL